MANKASNPFPSIHEVFRLQSVVDLVAEHSAEMVYIQDAAGQLLAVTPSVERLTGLPPHEYLVRCPDLLEINSPRTKAAIEFWSKVKHAKTGEIIGPFMVDITHADTTRRTHLVRECWIEHEGERFLLGLAHDITKLTFSEHAIEHVLTQTGLVNYYGEFTNEGPKTVYLSPGFERLYAISAESVLANSSLFMSHVHPDDIERVESVVLPVFKGQGPMNWSLRYRIVHDDGEIRWLHDRGVIATGLNNIPQHWIGIAEDITEQVREEEAQREREARMVTGQKLEAVGHLASGIAHHFSNLLLAMQGHTDLARRTLEPGHPALVSLERIEEAATQARGMTRSLLTFSHHRKSEYQPLDLSERFERGVQLLRRSLTSRIKLVATIEPELMTYGDGSELDQVLLNLALNARDAMPEGGELRISLAKEGGSARLTIQDTGSGISADDRERAFEPFFTTKPSGEGTGLGLSLSRNIVREHAGRIWIEPPRPMQEPGTTFVVELPLHQPGSSSDDTAAVPDPSSKPIQRVVLLHAPGLVERVVISMLTELGLEVARTHAHEDALAQLRLRPAAAFIVDCDIMSNEHKAEMAAALKATEVPRVIMLTSDLASCPTPELQAEVVKVAKPFMIADLAQALDQQHGTPPTP